MRRGGYTDSPMPRTTTAFGEYVSPKAVEECEQSYYGGVSDHVGLLCEAYAQYLCKSYGID